MKLLRKFEFDRSLALGLIASLCWLGHGTGQANFGNSTTLPKFVENFPSLDKEEPGISASAKAYRALMVGLITSIYELGLGFGGLSTYFLGDWLGRKKMTYVAATVLVIGDTVQASAFDLGQLYVGRIIAGLGIGAFSATVPAWVTETVSPHKRGALIMFGGGFSITGIATVTWVILGLYIHQRNHEIAWRLPIAIQGIVAVLVIIAAIFMDESPRTLIRKNRREEAYRVMKRNRSEKERGRLDEEYQEAIEAYEMEIASKDKSPWKRNEHKQLTRTLTAAGLLGITEMAGINLITFYGAHIFHDLGLSTTRARIALAGLQTWQAICAFSAIWFVSRVGRRNLLLYASATMTVCFCCCAGLQSNGSQGAKYGILAFDAIQLAAYPLGLFMNPFLVSSEISGLLCRSAVMALGAFLHWTLNFVIALVTPLGFQEIGYRYYIVYVACNAATFVFAYFLIPETTGLTIEEIDQAYIRTKRPWDIVRCANEVRNAGRIFPENFSVEKDEKGSVEMIEHADFKY